MACVGVNIGALTVKVVALRGGDCIARVMPHQGRPLEVLEEILAAADFTHAEFFGVSGHLGHLSEVAAIQRALSELDGDFDAAVSLGGESFLVYLLTDGRITNVLSHNKCAAGSGEFFVQQIGRMGLNLEEAIRRSFAGKVVPLASRCSVHCKSDITHKLNRNEATPEDILHTLHDSMAGKVTALLEKGQRELRRVLLIGGVTRNAAMLAALRQKMSGAEFVVLPESPWFEAWGSALLTRGYAGNSALVGMAVRDLETPRLLAEQAWTAAVRAQMEAESAMRQLGQPALVRAVAEGKPAILLAGQSVFHGGYC